MLQVYSDNLAVNANTAFAFNNVVVDIVTPKEVFVEVIEKCESLGIYNIIVEKPFVVDEILQKNTEKMQREIEQRKNQTSTLQSDIINLKAQIKDLATASLSTSNKKTDNTEQMNKFLKQRYRENADLNNVVLNLKAQISELENEQHNYVLQISNIQKLENIF